MVAGLPGTCVSQGGGEVAFLPFARGLSLACSNMYHLRTKGSVTRFKLASWMWLCKWLLVAAACALLAYCAIAGEQEYLVWAPAMLVAALLAGAVQWVFSHQAHCPLCLTPPLGHHRCAKHRKARRLCGSYRLRVACNVIFSHYFRCPYCGEATAMRMRASPLG